MQYVVIKSEYIGKAKEKWGEGIVNSSFEMLSKNHPDYLIQSLRSEGDHDKADCIIFLLQNKYSKDETLPS